MKKHFFFAPVALLLIMFSFPPQCTQAETLRISAAASMRDAIKELSEVFKKDNPDVSILHNFASSGSLAKQILRGAPADLYISANQKWVQYLLQKGMVTPEFTSLLARNRLVFAGKKRSGVRSIKDITSLSLIALGNPKSVPAGQYAAQAMQTAGIYNLLKRSHKLVISKDVRQALLYAERGEADGAFVYLTDALLTDRIQIFFTVAESLHDPVMYPVALTQTGTEKKDSRAYYRFLHSPAAASILGNHGFQTPTGVTR